MDGDSQAPRLAVSACVWRGDRFLLVERAKDPNRGLWSLPGGSVDFGETLADAAARELREETAMEADLRHLVDVVEAIRHDDMGRPSRHYVIVVFGGPWRAGEPVAGDDAGDAEWLTVDELRGRPVTSGLVAVLEKAARLAAAD
jgi:ADP-ribose pyrophosphatase YjhB (NUDIX family)